MLEDSEHTGPPEEAVRLRSELEAAKRKLEECYKLASLGRLVTGIAHEISTPVGSILSNNALVLHALETLKKLLAEFSGDSPPQLAKARKIVDTLSSLAGSDRLACDRIAAVVPGLKTFARVEETELRKADLNQILRNTLALVQAQFRSRIVFETELGALPEVECYPQSLHQVFLNLLTNGCEAIEGPGKVTVRTGLEGDQVQVSIADTGTGIKPEHRSRIFSRGFTTKPVGLGAGLGLSISAQIVVDRHGGSIDFKTAPGVGTTFHVRLPVAQNRKAPG
jgi:signal transduction histidine kinase